MPGGGGGDAPSARAMAMTPIRGWCDAAAASPGAVAGERLTQRAAVSSLSMHSQLTGDLE